MVKHNQSKEVFWNIVNAVLAGCIALFSSLITLLSEKELTGDNIAKAVSIAAVTSALVALYKFQTYWQKEENDYCRGLFNLV